MDNPGITHNTHLERLDLNIQTYVQTGVIHLDLDHLATPVLSLDSNDAERLVAILRAALADREA